MGSKKISSLCQSVLPPGFEEVAGLGPAIQHFLEQNLPESVNQAVTLLTVNQHEIVIAANSPMVTNYLRLHSSEIAQQLRETLHLEQVLKFRTVPDSLLRIDKNQATREPLAVSEESIRAIRRNADWIEDEDLKAALLSLAESLKTD